MDQAHVDQLLDPQTIARAEALGLQARHVVEGYMAGEHKSPYRGFAIEFAQHREYTHGDDTRHLDWKVLGRTDRYYIKQYEQETNYVANILLDGSESMKYGSGAVTKFDYGRQIAACLAFLILHQRDAAALGIFDQSMRDYSPRSDNRSTIHRVMSRLAAFQPTQQTGIATVLHDIANQLRRKGIIIVISDFFDDEAKVLARVRLATGSGKITVNGRAFDNYFPLETLRSTVSGPLAITGTTDKIDVRVNVTGGGPNGQAGDRKSVV